MNNLLIFDSLGWGEILITVLFLILFFALCFYAIKALRKYLSNK